MSWFMQALSNYAAFEGRARRKEYWYFTLFFIIASVVAGVVDGLIGLPILSILVFLGLILPSISVGVRRLHDTGRSGWWYLLSFIPLIGAIILIIFFVMDSKPETNIYGPNPKA